MLSMFFTILTLLLNFFFLSIFYYFYSPFVFQLLVFSIVVKLYVGEDLVSTLYLCPIQFVILWQIKHV